MPNSSDLFDKLPCHSGEKNTAEVSSLLSFCGVEDFWFSGFMLERDDLVAPSDIDELFYLVLVLNENVNNCC